MGQKENKLIKQNMLELDPYTQRRFRINSGMAWAGSVLRGFSIMSYIKKIGTKKCILIVNPRPFHGAPEGFPDVIGWDTIEITPDMVGQRVAVFVGDEYKTTGRLSKEQKIFGGMLEHMGGIWRVIRG